jgi:hypothetical protein
MSLVNLNDLKLRNRVTPVGAAAAATGPAALLFASGEQGFWLDSSDRTTMYQDLAGTTPVTAYEQSVGKWTDKSGRNNHFTATSLGARPLYSARYNEWWDTRDMTSANWLRTGTTIALDSTLPPASRSGEPVFLLREDTSTGAHQQRRGYFMDRTFQRKLSTLTFKAAGRGFIKVYANDSLERSGYINLSTGGISNITNSLFIFTRDAGNGWYHVTWGFTPDTTSVTATWELAQTAGGSTSYTGDGVSGVYVTSPDVRLTDASPYAGSPSSMNIPGYQWVDAVNNLYDTNAAFPPYLSFTGTKFMSATDVAGARAAIMTFAIGHLNQNLAVRGDWISSGDSGAAATTNWIVGSTGGGGSQSVQLFGRTPGTAVTASGVGSSFNDGESKIMNLVTDGANQTYESSGQAVGPNVANVLGTDNTTGFFLGGSSAASVMGNGAITKMYQVVVRAATTTTADRLTLNRFIGQKMGVIF